jgi:hypothetical protein
MSGVAPNDCSLIQELAPGKSVEHFKDKATAEDCRGNVRQA